MSKGPDASRDIRDFIPRFLKLVQPFSVLTRRALIWIILMQVLALAEPTVVMYVINHIAIQTPGFSDHLIWVMVLMFAGLSSVGIAQVIKNRAIREVWLAMEHDLPLRCGQKLLALPLSYHQRENTGAIVGKVVRGVSKCTDVIAVLLWEIFPLVAQSLVTVALLLWLSRPAALVLLPVVMVFGWMTARMKIRLSRQRMQRHEIDGEADEALGQAVTNVMTTQAFAQEERELRAVEAIRDKVRVLARDEFNQYDKSDFVRNATVSLGRTGVIYACAVSAITGSMSMGAMVFVITLAEKVFVSCYRIGAVFDRLMEASEPVMRMTQIFEEPEKHFGPECLPVPERFRGDIAFENVCFTYVTGTNGARRKKPALSNVSLCIGAGETVGIVGESGGGKSTLVKALLAFIDADEGEVSIDGLDVARMQPTVFRRQIGYVPQEVEIYDCSVADNIAYGRPEATREDIMAAAAIANAHDFIAGLPSGYDELVGNRGLRLSGGQRQRIGIARAVLLDPPILVLDEATSHVDVVSERKIHASVEKLRRGKTVLIIAHRLSTVQNADRIIVLEEGRVKEVGTHRELLEKRGVYQHLVELQTKVEATT